MKELLEALSKFSPAQLLTSLAILTPFVAGIWVVLKWAYDTRLKNLETALADFRSDFERRLARELAKTTDAHEKQLEHLQGERQAARSNAESMQADIDRLLSNFEESKKAVRQRAEELASAEHDLVALLEVGEFSELPPRYVAYLCEHPMLISKISFSESQVASLRIQAEEGQGNAMYLYGRMLVTGRLLREGLLPPDKEQGLALIRSAAEKGHLPSRSFVL
jgi:TPR repeat protein